MKYHRRRAGGPCQTLSLAALLLLLLLLPAAGVERALRIVDKTGQEVGLYTASYALGIGVSEYTNGWPSLPGVADDVAAVAQVLTEQGFEVTVVQNPTSTGLRDAFDAFIHRYGLVPEHRLLIYFAGHGHTIKQSYGDEMGYLVPTNAPNPYQDKNGFLATAMDMQQIEVYAKRIQTKHVLFLFDSCFSGSIFSLSRAVPEHIHYKTSQPVRQFITAGRADEQVPDRSVFRQQFQAALHGEADADGDGYITGTELGEFLTNKVINYSNNAQHPQYGKIRNPNLDKGDFVFKITVTLTGPAPAVQVESTTPSGARDISGLEQRLLDKLDQLRQQGKAADPETEMWGLVKDSPHVEDIKAFLEAYPNGQFAAVARLRLQQVQRQAAVPAPAAERQPPAAARQDTPSVDTTASEASPPPGAPSVPQYPRGYVQRIQRLLRQEGLEPGAVDGMLGQRTEEALRQYQAWRSLPVTGQPDEATDKALQADESKRVQEQQRREAASRQSAQTAERHPAPTREAEPGAAPKTSAPRQTAGVQGTLEGAPAHPKIAAFPKTLRNSIGMDFVLIPAGDFTMGAYDGLPHEQPVHKVTISRPFYLGKYEVTQGEWMAVMENNPSYFINLQSNGAGFPQQVGRFFSKLGGAAEAAPPKLDPHRPVERVSWQQAQEFIRRLNAKEGHDKYRLPTEAEWEYAARAGTATRYSFGDNDGQLAQYGWCVQNAGGKTQPVGQLKPNAWGLYDMQGNVLEWVLDWWAPQYPSGPVRDPEGPPSGTLKVLRGGSWAHAARQCRVSERLYNAPQVPHTTYGFRLLRMAP